MTDYDVLHMFAWYHGRYWKQKLRDTWARACADQPEEWRGALQRLRNAPDFGPRSLARYKVPTVDRIVAAQTHLDALRGKR